jgi:hypothetical protein
MTRPSAGSDSTRPAHQRRLSWDHDPRLQAERHRHPVRRADMLQGKVIGHQRHRHQEFLRFLGKLDQEFLGEVPLHLIIDNYETHKHANVRVWRRRLFWFVLHFVPTSSSWLNLVAIGGFLTAQRSENSLSVTAYVNGETKLDLAKFARRDRRPRSAATASCPIVVVKRP